MLVKDIKYDGKGIFETMQEVCKCGFINDGHIMDKTFNALYGQREVSSFIHDVLDGDINSENMKLLSMVIYNMFGSKWDNLYEMIIEHLPMESYNMVTRETIEDKGENESSNINEVTNKDVDSVSGYNSDDFIDDKQSDRVTTDDGKHQSTNSNNRVRELKASGNLSNTFDDRRKKVDYLINTLKYDTIYVDVARLVGTLIY